MSEKQTAHQDFLTASERIVFDKEHRRKIVYNISKYDQAVVLGKQQFRNLEFARKRAAVIRSKAINNLDAFLIEFEKNFEERGGKVIWALDANNAIKEILTIMKNNRAKLVVKSKSMVSEEIEINKHLIKKDIEVVETDLGEFIVQQREEPPYHIVTPAMHLSKEDVADLFHKKFELPKDSSPEQITAFVRNLIRDKFLNADIGITGANFLIADTGSVAITENEGNAMMSMSFPKIHIVLAGIEKIIPSLSQLDLFWPLLATHGTGQFISVYNSIVSGPKQEYETDGPAKMYVILIDNKRTELLGQHHQRKALTCIRCGACLNACPVYCNVGGHAYGTTYSGPIGAIITPWMKGMEEFKHLSFASTLCGRCTEVCPVHIKLHELLLFNRNDAIKQKYYSRSEKFVMWTYKKLLTGKGRPDTLSAGAKNRILQRFFAKAWGQRRTLPVVKKQSFRQLYLKYNENKVK
ncbi:MAG: lactate utilization protein B [Bacteroidales bacterium]|nr:lactate utilization protein B [Bacteroidales bacterium]MDZ4204283.1 lactate utilization protein B [Bacteroidales bacterium]